MHIDRKVVPIVRAGKVSSRRSSIVHCYIFDGFEYIFSSMYKSRYEMKPVMSLTIEELELIFE